MSETLMLHDLGGVDVHIPDWIKTKDFKLIESIEELKVWVDSAIELGIFALDLETQGLDNRVYFNSEQGRFETVHKIVGYCLCKDDHSARYVPIRHKKGFDKNLDVELVDKEIERLVRNAKPIFQNAKFDIEFLSFTSSPCDLDHYKSFEDTLIAHFVKDSNIRVHGLKKISFDILGYRMIELSELFPKTTKKRDFSNLSPTGNGVVEYACSDAFCTFMLWVDHLHTIADEYPLIYNIEKRTVSAIRRMERARVLVDKDLVIELQRGAEEERAKYAKLFREQSKPYLKSEETKIDISSPQQIADLLYKRMGIPVEIDRSKDSKTDQISTDAETLGKIKKKFPNKYPILDTIFQYKSMDTIISRYLSKLSVNLDENNEARLKFNGWSANTARLSSSGGQPDQGFTGVNWQSLPKPYDVSKSIISRRIREVAKARSGYALVKIDFSGEELRITANMSGEPKWVKEFMEGDGDLHSLMAIEVFGDVSGNSRSNAKNTNFALLYGGGVAAIQRATGLPKHEAKRLIDKYFKKLPTLKRWIENQKKSARTNGVVYTQFKRPFYLPQLKSDDQKTRAFGERKAVNSPIQGTGADIIKYAMGEVDRVFMDKGWYPDIARMIINVHDELVFEIKLEHLEEIVPVCCDCMTRFYKAAKWTVPLEVEPLIGLNWSSPHDWDKMKRGDEDVPEWLVPYIKVEKMNVGANMGDTVGSEPIS